MVERGVDWPRRHNLILSFSTHMFVFEHFYEHAVMVSAVSSCLLL